jgi:hypothetical protein
MAGLGGYQAFAARKKDVDACVKRGHDVERFAIDR